MKKKKEIILMSITILVMIIFIISATYAYFSAVEGSARKTSVEVKTATTDVFTFSKSENINITADQYDFGEGMESKIREANVQVTLTANNSTNNVEENYYVYLHIEKNSFNYTQTNEDGTSNTEYPELLLTIIDPSGTELTTLDGYTHRTVTDNHGNLISGFDVTLAQGLITLVNNRNIVAGTSSSAGKGTISENWQIKLTYVNYDKDQTNNVETILGAKVLVRKDNILNVISDVCSGGETLSSCVSKLSTLGESKYTNIYHHDGSLENGIDDDSYRYAGNSNAVYNYVCIDSTETTCSEANLYRIIGYFKEGIKLIKATSIGSKVWNNRTINASVWSSSSLNTYLNGTYLTSLGTFATNYIATSTWKVGGNTYANIKDVVAATTYTNEIVSPKATELKKIGLMYVSDYGFAASPVAWATQLRYYNNSIDNIKLSSLNWISGDSEWTITRTTNSPYYAYYVSSSVFFKNVRTLSAVRPTFYLKSNVIYKSGTGTNIDPISLDIIDLAEVNDFDYTATTSSLTLTADVTKGKADISRYYFSIDNGLTYKESETNNYVFTELYAGTTYNVKIKVVDTLGFESNEYSGTVKTISISLSDICTSDMNLATCIKNYASIGVGNSKIFYHNGEYKDTDGTTVLDANDSSYRYTGLNSDVDNYVCISDETNCSDANLFRIIGVFGSQVKLIRAKSIGDMQWNSTASNTWSSASLNTYLNGTYLTSLGTFATNYIATSTWKVGGNTYAKIRDVVAASAYTNEITSPASATEVNDKKIGLMYASDYGFGAVPAAWSTTLYNYDGSVNGSTICSQDWLCLGSIEWLITPVSDYSNRAYIVGSSGYVNFSIGVTSGNAVRPVFYLLSTVTYKSGVGSSIDPIRLG